MGGADWTVVGPLDAISPGTTKVVRRGALQAALFRLDSGELYAVDNRCPHEGYPLVQGDLDGCTLTCLWHNYKFDLRDGRCLKGDEAVATYPVRVTDGQVELLLTAPDPAEAIPGYWASLSEALSERRVGQSVRDAARLLVAGVSPPELAAFVAAWDGEHAEWGASHALAVSADVLRWAPQYPGPQFAIPLAQVLDLASLGGVRRPAHAPAAAIDPGDDPAAAGASLRAAVEAEDLAQAEGLLRGALARGWRREIIEPWLFRLCTDHFLSFGHRLIYQIKAFDLLEEAGWTQAEPILRGHLRGIVNGTREDLLPAWAGFRKRLAALDLEALYARAGQDPDWAGAAALEAAVLDGKPAQALSAVEAALEAGAPLARIVDALSLAAAERMLRFDVSIDSDPSNQDNWLSVTHIQTFANAVRHAIERYPCPAVLRLLFFAARFANHHRVLDGAAEPTVAAEGATVEAAVAAATGGDVPAAMALAAGLADGEIAALERELMAVAISDRYAAPIVSAHAMKNLVVAGEEWRAHGDRRALLAGVRLLSGPLQQRWTHRGAREAVAFVTEGRIPKLLAP